MIPSVSAPALWLLFSLSVGLTLPLIRSQWLKPHRGWIELMRWILVPYLGLVSGQISPLLMGFVGLNWIATFEIGFTIVFVGLIIVALVRITQRHYRQGELRRSSQEKSLSRSFNLSSIQNSGFGWLVLTAVAREFHWTFLRAAIWESLLTDSQNLFDTPVNTAVWTATVLALFEMVVRRQSGQQWIHSITILIVTSVLFIYTRNFYLCAIMHGGMAYLLNISLQSKIQVTM